MGGGQEELAHRAMEYYYAIQGRRLRGWSLLTCGGSNWMIQSMSGMSMPRAATSVQSRAPVGLWEKRAYMPSRFFCTILPCRLQMRSLPPLPQQGRVQVRCPPTPTEASAPAAALHVRLLLAPRACQPCPCQSSLRGYRCCCVTGPVVYVGVRVVLPRHLYWIFLRAGSRGSTREK